MTSTNINKFSQFLQLVDQDDDGVASLQPLEALRKHSVDLIGFDRVPLKNQGLPLGCLKPKASRVPAAGLFVAHTIVRFGEHEGRWVPLPGYRFAASLVDKLDKPWYSPFTKDTCADDDDEGVEVHGIRTRVDINRAEFATDGYELFLLSEDAEDLDRVAHVPPRPVGVDPAEYLAEHGNVYLSFYRWGDPAALFNSVVEMAKAAKVPTGVSIRLTFVGWFDDIAETHKPGCGTGLISVYPVAVRVFWSPLGRPSGGEFVAKLLRNRQSLSSLLNARGVQQSQAQARRPQPQAQPQPQPQYDPFEAYCGLRLMLGDRILDIEDAIFHRSRLTPAALAAMREEVEASGMAPADLVSTWRRALARFEAACMPDPVVAPQPAAPEPGSVEDLLAAAAEVPASDVPDDAWFEPGAFDPHEWGLKPQDLILNVGAVEVVDSDKPENDDSLDW